MKNVLLHICCAPCAVSPFELLDKDGFLVKGFFFNPNIQPAEEYQKRKSALELYAAGAHLEFESTSYEPQIFLEAVSINKETPLRCHICWRLRLKETARKAQKEGFAFFTTTLLGSPYQDTKVLEAIGKEEAKAVGVEFLIRDFKAGFRQAHSRCEQDGIYCQNYCGCIYSAAERAKAKSSKDTR
jgi:predicted adenine nucleotide alpha hydrolase (AANH) superfamily ATPase